MQCKKTDRCAAVRALLFKLLNVKHSGLATVAEAPWLVVFDVLFTSNIASLEFVSTLHLVLELLEPFSLMIYLTSFEKSVVPQLLQAITNAHNGELATASTASAIRLRHLCFPPKNVSAVGFWNGSISILSLLRI